MLGDWPRSCAPERDAASPTESDSESESVESEAPDVDDLFDACIQDAEASLVDDCPVWKDQVDALLEWLNHTHFWASSYGSTHGFMPHCRRAIAHQLELAKDRVAVFLHRRNESRRQVAQVQRDLSFWFANPVQQGPVSPPVVRENRYPAAVVTPAMLAASHVQFGLRPQP